MPHFENLDQYESTNPKSGDKEIVPIAPHSLQASEYSPDKENASVVRKRRRKKEFPDVNIEPISVRQMEREYRASGKKLPHSRKKGRLRKLKRKIAEFFRSLLGLKKKKRKNRNNRNRRSRNRQAKKQTGGQNKDNQGQKNNQGQNRNRRRRKRSGQNRQGQAQGQGSNKGQAKKQGPALRSDAKHGPSQRSDAKHGPKKTGGQEKPKDGAAQGSGKSRSRNRRNRRRPQNPNNPGSSGNQRQDNSR